MRIGLMKKRLNRNVIRGRGRVTRSNQRMNDSIDELTKLLIVLAVILMIAILIRM